MRSVLQGRPREQKLEVRFNAAQILADFRIFILDLVGLIDDKVLVVEPLDVLEANIDALVGCKAHVELSGLEVLVDDLVTLLLDGY